MIWIAIFLSHFDHFSVVLFSNIYFSLPTFLLNLTVHFSICIDAILIWLNVTPFLLFRVYFCFGTNIHIFNFKLTVLTEFN